MCLGAAIEVGVDFPNARTERVSRAINGTTVSCADTVAVHSHGEKNFTRDPLLRLGAAIEQVGDDILDARTESAAVCTARRMRAHNVAKWIVESF